MAGLSASMDVQSAALVRWTRGQQGAALLVALAILLDGFDSQIIALMLPAIARDWHVDKAAFAPVLAAGTIGIAFGSMLAGQANDRFGRRPSLIASMVLVGVANLAAIFAPGLAIFGAIRFAIGLGIGAAFASATTSLAEFTPAHRRSTVISFGILCMPVGGLVASGVCAAVLAPLGWQPILAMGGVLPLALALVLMVWLPETPQFLSTRPERAPELVALRRRLGIVHEEEPVRDPSTPATGRGWRLSRLLSPEFRRDTVLVWIAFFACLLSSYIGIQWIPSLFAQATGSLTLSSAALAANGVGAIAGSVICVALVQRIGTRGLMVGAGVLGVVALVVLAMLFDRGGLAVVFLLIAGSTLAIAMTQSLLYVLVAQVYPAEMRGSGVGIGMGVGRLGAVASAFVGGWALHLGGRAFFLVDAATLAVAVVAAMAIRRHIAAA